MIAHALIFSYVSSSSRRVQTGAAPHEGQRRPISNRDLHLLRHMIIMFCVSVGGQTPFIITNVVHTYTPVSPVLLQVTAVWYQLGLLFTTIDLFLYNHEVRKYVAGYFFRCVRH